MATLKKLKTQIENANALGVANLAEKGVEISESATTYEIMQSIAEVSSGGGASLNIAYGETAPEDTSKLWIKANEPTNLLVSSGIESLERVEALGTYLPYANSYMGCAKVGDKVYLFGGNGVNSSTAINVFDIKTQTITTLQTTLPASMALMGCASVGTKIYLLGGKYGGYNSNKILEFDTETETITILSATLPVTNQQTSCVSVGSKVYMIGGEGSSGFVQNIIVFDTETQVATKLSAQLSYSAHSIASAAVGTKIYMFGGRNGYIGSYDTISVFDIETQTVTTLSVTLPTQMSGLCCGVIGEKIYLFGYNTCIYVFDTNSQTINELSTTLPNACSGGGCSTDGLKIYLFGGTTNIIHRFTVTHELTQGNIEIQSGLFNNKFNLIKTDNAQIEIGVENVLVGNENNEAQVVEAYLHNGTQWQQI